MPRIEAWSRKVWTSDLNITMTAVWACGVKWMPSTRTAPTALMFSLGRHASSALVSVADFFFTSWTGHSRSLHGSVASSLQRKNCATAPWCDRAWMTSFLCVPLCCYDLSVIWGKIGRNLNRLLIALVNYHDDEIQTPSLPIKLIMESDPKGPRKPCQGILWDTIKIVSLTDLLRAILLIIRTQDDEMVK